VPPAWCHPVWKLAVDDAISGGLARKPLFGPPFEKNISTNWGYLPDGRPVRLATARWARKVTIQGSSPHMGLSFNPVNSFPLILDFSAGEVLKVDPLTGLCQCS
jgi:hypothetical protein